MTRSSAIRPLNRNKMISWSKRHVMLHRDVNKAGSLKAKAKSLKAKARSLKAKARDQG